MTKLLMCQAGLSNLQSDLWCCSSQDKERACNLGDPTLMLITSEENIRGPICVLC